MSCPYLKETVMLYCDACGFRKMIPLERLASASPCLAPDFDLCPVFREREGRATGPEPIVLPDARVATRR